MTDAVSPIFPQLLAAQQRTNYLLEQMLLGHGVSFDHEKSLPVVAADPIGETFEDGTEPVGGLPLVFAHVPLVDFSDCDTAQERVAVIANALYMAVVPDHASVTHYVIRAYARKWGLTFDLDGVGADNGISKQLWKWKKERGFVGDSSVETMRSAPANGIPSCADYGPALPGCSIHAPIIPEATLLAVAGAFREFKAREGQRGEGAVADMTAVPYASMTRVLHPRWRDMPNGFVTELANRLMKMNFVIPDGGLGCRAKTVDITPILKVGR